MNTPSPYPPEFVTLTELKIKEQERRRDALLAQDDDASDAPRRKLSGGLFIFVLVMALIMLIIGYAIAHHLF